MILVIGSLRRPMTVFGQAFLRPGRGGRVGTDLDPRRWPSPRADGKNIKPDNVPVGARSHAFTATVREGNAFTKVAA